MANEIDKILGDLVMCLHPEYMMEGPLPITKLEGFDKEEADKYWRAITSINWIVKKTGRYPAYFEKFYPSDGDIKEYEALEHHVDAYLEDLITVKNKLTAYIGMLKNDLSKIATNKQEIVGALNWLNKQITKAFDDVSKYRNPHRHHGYRFADGNIVDNEMAHMVLDDASPIKARLTPKGLEFFEKKKRDSFENGKKDWIEKATKNSTQMSGLSNDVLAKTKDFLYQYLHIKGE